MSTARTSDGFTLVELLVAITLLGLLMSALFGGLQLGARAWETGQTRVEASSRLQVVQQFIRTRLEEAVPVFLTDRRGDERVAFRGQPDQVSFVGTLPEVAGGGLHQFTLGLSEDDGEGHNLSLAWRRFMVDEEGVLVPGPVAGRRNLMTGIAGLSFAYYGFTADDGAPAWHESWGEPDLMPTLVRLAVGYGEGDPRTWPELAVRPMIERPPQGLY